MYDITDYKKDFPALSGKMNGQDLVFLDSAASAQKPRQVINAMSKSMSEGYANIHRGLYEYSQNITTKYEEARGKIASFIGAESSDEIVFTRNSTEAINLIAGSWGEKFLREGDEIILTEMEHHANIVPWQLLRKRKGIIIKTVPVDDNGCLELDKLEGLLGKKTKLVSFVHVSNSLGTINPAAEIVKKTKEYNEKIPVLIDGSQACVHLPVDVKSIGCDFYVITGHKIYGPTGSGALYGRKEILEAMPPYQGGGDMIEEVSFEKTTFKPAPHKFEAGTPAIVEAIGLGEAIEYVQRVGMSNIAAHEKELLGYGTELLEAIPGFNMFGKSPDKIALFSFNIDGFHPDDIAMILDKYGIAVRSGHHCCMPLMRKFGISSTVRASTAIYSDKNDLDKLAEGLKKAIKLLS